MVAITLDATSAGKVLGLAGSVYAILQVVKVKFPSVTGYWAIGLNVALSVIGVLVLLPPEHLWSLNSFTTLMIAGITAASAAGIHGTVPTLPQAVQKVTGQATSDQAG